MALYLSHQRITQVNPGSALRTMTATACDYITLCLYLSLGCKPLKTQRYNLSRFFNPPEHLLKCFVHNRA